MTEDTKQRQEDAAPPVHYLGKVSMALTGKRPAPTPTKKEKE